MESTFRARSCEIRREDSGHPRPCRLGPPYRPRGRPVKILFKYGYSPKVAFDELNAYITTGENNIFKSLDKKKEFKNLRKKLKKVHKDIFKNWKNEKC
jgi:hypothetical protein